MFKSFNKNSGLSKKFRRSIAILLSLCMIMLAFPLNLIVWSSAAENTTGESPYRVLKKIASQESANYFTSGDSGGYQMASNNHQFNTGYTSSENLAVYLNLYIENRTNPGDLSLLNDAGFQQIQWLSRVVDGVYYEVCWNKDQIKKLNLQSGWNEVLLKFSTNASDGKPGVEAFKCTADLTYLNNFRVVFTSFPNTYQDKYRIRVSNVCVVDTSLPAESTPGETEYPNTERLVGSYPGFDNAPVTSTNNNAGGGTINTGAKSPAGGAIDATGHDPSKLYLSLDMYFENTTHPGGPYGDSFDSGRIRIASKSLLGSNMYFLNKGQDYNQAKPGEWTSLMIPLKNLKTNASGNPNVELSGLIAAINDFGNMDAYVDSTNHTEAGNRPGCVPEEFGSSYKFELRNVKIVDASNDLRVPTLFGDNMMFQQNKPIKVWGNTANGNTVKVSLYNEDEEEPVAVKSDIAADNSWEVKFDAIAGGMDSYRMVIEDMDGDSVINTKEINDILIGEVWVAGGQSNMALSVNDDINRDKILDEAVNDKIRFYLEPSYPDGDNAPQALQPGNSVTGAYWGKGDSRTDVTKASSIAYNFIKELQEALGDVPVGFLNTATGGTVIEAWISRGTIDDEKNSDYQQFLDDENKYCDDYWWPERANRMSTLYIQKIGPLVGYNAAGAIWYQGESNINEASMYDRALEVLKEDWGNVFGFGDGDMPFIFTHLAPHYYSGNSYSSPSTVMGYMAESMSDMWEKTKAKNTAQITIYDLPATHLKTDGNSAGDIHPTNKIPISNRFFTSAYNLVYSGTGVNTAPVYDSMTVTGSSIKVKFDCAGSGLKIGGGSGDLHGFAIAGADGMYYPARARIVSSDTVEVWNVTVDEPENVTYAFNSFNVYGNLLNSGDIAAVPFRTNRSAEDSKLLNNQDWVYADGEVWVSIDGSLPDKERAVYKDLWASNGETSYDQLNKAEGAASLKVQYEDSGVIKTGPTFGNRSMTNQFDHFERVSVQIKNGDNRAKQLSLAITSGGKEYLACGIGEESDQTALTVAANSDFTAYYFDLTKLMDGNTAVTDTTNILKNLTAFEFVVTDSAGGTVWLDDVMFGAYSLNEEEPYEPSGDVKLGDVNGDNDINIFDIMEIRDHIFGKKTLSGNPAIAADVNSDGDINIFDIMMIRDFIFGKLQSL